MEITRHQAIEALNRIMPGVGDSFEKQFRSAYREQDKFKKFFLDQWVFRAFTCVETEEGKEFWNIIHDIAENYNFTMIEIISQAFPDHDILIADGFDAAAIGIDESSMRLIYSVSKCIEILQEDMSHEEAIKYFELKVAGAYVGEKTPIWCYDNL